MVMTIRLYKHDNPVLFSTLHTAFKDTKWYYLPVFSSTNKHRYTHWKDFTYWLWTDYTVWADTESGNAYLEFTTDEQRVEFLLKWL